MPNTVILASQNLIMRKPLSLLLICSLFFSCSKTLEHQRLHPGIDLRFCNIRSWTHPHLGETRSNTFTYNALGNPVNVTSNMEGTGSGFHYFTYDDQVRLSVHEHEFTYTYYYYYEGNSRRPTGCTRIDAYGREYEETFTWDNKGRIVGVNAAFVSTPFEDEINADEEVTYVYDDRNLIGYDINGHQQYEFEYTNKPSLFFANKVWMLVNRNYSRNAPTGAATYNKTGLPLTYHEQPPVQPSFLDMGYESAVITYHCR